MFESRDSEPENNEIHHFQIEFGPARPETDFSNFLDLRQPWDGTQPEVSKEEQEAVKELFTSNVDDTILHHIEDMEDYGGNITELRLKHTPENADELNISVLRTDSLRVVNVKQGDMIANYSSEVDGTITRNDLEDDHKVSSQLKDRENYEIYDYDSPEVATEKRLNFFDQMEQMTANYNLAKEMGYAQQPISLDEAQRLFELLDNSIPENNHE